MARKPVKETATGRAVPLKIDNARKHLSADPLFTLIRQGFKKIPDHRPAHNKVSLADAMMSAFAMFSLKEPSLLAFDGKRNDENLKAVYQIHEIPCDTHLRTILDPVEPEMLRPLFRDVFRQL